MGSTVIEYLHAAMKDMPIDFRIITDDQGFDIFANWQDVLSIPDLDAQTVYYRPLAPEPTGVVMADYAFQNAGGCIGIIIAENPVNQNTYNAVFYFEVGNTGFGYVPLFVCLIIGAQLLFFASTGTLRRILPGRREQRTQEP